MKIELKIDNNAIPYLELNCSEIIGRDVRSDLLEHFIKLAKEKGLVIKNESDFYHSNNYATIRINPKEESKNE